MISRAKTMTCVAIAGLVFISTVMFNRPYLALVGAFFDWLPLPTGWMKSTGKVNRLFLKLHVVITSIAYGIFIAWLVTGDRIVALVFLEVWWVAVVVGTFIGN